MDAFKALLEGLGDKVFPITPKGRIQQKEQTQLKKDLVDALASDFEEAGIETYLVQKGLVVLIENDEEGAIPIEIDIITKPLDYDYIGLNDEYIAKQKD